ncbi:hypothetical protein Y695_04576 [Hydrogenophaga sp. T4]|nr:hypothetical protein Y695_04576 [Hydrogenophaga sp. T4]
MSAPVGASAVAIMEDRRELNTRPMAAQVAMARYTTIDIQAVGTCTKMMR